MKLIVFDTNVLHNRWELDSPVFEQLRLLIESHPGDVRAAIPEVVIEEAVANHRREADESVRKLGKLLPRQMFIELSVAVERYEERLRARLADLGIEILAYPDVGHQELVRRAAQRRAPNKASTGDGYRDTLNWFVLLGEASRLSCDDEVIWVSKDGDFRASSEESAPPKSQDRHPVLHQHLVEDMGSRSIDCHIFLHKSADIAIEYLQNKIDPDNADVSRVKTRISESEIAAFLENGALRTLSDVSVTARALALPRTATKPKLVAQFAPHGEPVLTVAGPVDDGIRVRAEWQIPVVISYYRPDLELADDADPEPVWAEEHKTVAVVVDLVTDRDAKPIDESGHISEVTALSDGPGRTAWATPSTTGTLPAQEFLAKALAGYQESLREAAQVRVPVVKIPPVNVDLSTLKQINEMTEKLYVYLRGLGVISPDRHTQTSGTEDDEGED